MATSKLDQIIDIGTRIAIVTGKVAAPNVAIGVAVVRLLAGVINDIRANREEAIVLPTDEVLIGRLEETARTGLRENQEIRDRWGSDEEDGA